MTDEYIDICEKVQKKLCDDLCMTECQKTYELAKDIVDICSLAFAKFYKELDELGGLYDGETNSIVSEGQNVRNGDNIPRAFCKNGSVNVINPTFPVFKSRNEHD